MNNKFVLGLILFFSLAVMLAAVLRLPGASSPLIGQSAPAFNLPLLHDPNANFSPESMRGKVWMLNVWASWCATCRDEHTVLIAYAQTPGAVPIVGLNWNDNRINGLRWLMRYGDPFLLSIYDPDGRVGGSYGVYRPPETYLIDKQGVVRFKHTGALTPWALERRILPLIEELSQ